jgi:hypothetical protein
MSNSNHAQSLTPADWQRAATVVSQRSSCFHELAATKLFLKKIEAAARGARYGMQASGGWLMAPSGSGKTRTLLACQHMLVRQTDLDTEVPFISITLLPAPTMHTIARDLLSALRYPFANSNNFSERANLLFNGLKNRRVRAVFIDEAHHIVEGNGTSNQRDIRNLLKRLLDETNVCLVMSGLESLKKLRDSDAQLRSRLPAEVVLKTALDEEDGRIISDQLVEGSPIAFTAEARALLKTSTTQRVGMTLREYCAVLDESVKVAALGGAPAVGETHVRHAVGFVFLTGSDA